MIRVAKIMAVLGLIVMSATSFAHQQKAAISKVLFNQRTGNIEIMHRFNLHDAEHAVKVLFGKEADFLVDESTLGQFTHYVEDTFALQLDGSAVKPRLVGSEIDGKHIWVYQETAIPETLDSMRITFTALTEIWPAQLNTVNVEGRGDLQTRQFSAQQPAQTVTF
ncbi:DUF6702 family protein [Aestuariibacter salexigens]|uniref:DUF6702 family protein n=1 Tax=Aestuariibacter salexigens TaxID=226010 RepID=UPI00040AF2D0|nr:DUF6702 family protein [Aestuariibacter salexigens]